MKIKYNEIQTAMEDVRRDRFDYYLDLNTGEVITLPVAEIEKALSLLYNESPDDDFEPAVEFDSAVNLQAELDEQQEEAIEMALLVLSDESRFVRIPERPSSHAFATMRSFANTVKNPSLKHRLLQALNGPGSFRRFKDVLLSDKKQRKRWHGYNAKEMKVWIQKWIEQINKKITLTD